MATNYPPPGPHVPRSQRAGRLTRSVFCRACGHDSGIPGAAFCDGCRPTGTPALLSDTDRRLLAEAGLPVPDAPHHYRAPEDRGPLHTYHD